ncbi:MAG: hypothetical protein OHK006_06140 [Thermodesulfovibrionales bacterium]
MNSIANLLFQVRPGREKNQRRSSHERKSHSRQESLSQGTPVMPDKERPKDQPEQPSLQAFPGSDGKGLINGK